VRPRRLYLRLYLAFLGVMVAVVLVVTAIGFIAGRPFFATGREGRDSRSTSAPAAASDRPGRSRPHGRRIHDELGMDIV